jgi:chromosome transmission fidelity protein 1
VTSGQLAQKQEMMAASSLMSLLGAQVDGVNLLEIEGYLKRSKVARKISGYSDKAAEKAEEGLWLVNCRTYPRANAVF